MPTDDIMNFIENKGQPSGEAKKKKEDQDLTKSAKRKKNKKSKKAAATLLKNIPLLKGFKINPSTPDSSADRLTSAGTPRNRKDKDRDGNIVIKDESEEQQPKVKY